MSVGQAKGAAAGSSGCEWSTVAVQWKRRCWVGAAGTGRFRVSTTDDPRERDWSVHQWNARAPVRARQLAHGGHRMSAERQVNTTANYLIQPHFFNEYVMMKERKV